MAILDRLAVGLRVRLSQPINTSAAIIMAVYTFLWGLWVINPFWTVFTTASLYSTLMAIMPEFWWGAIAVVCGGFMIAGVLRHSFSSLSRGAFVGFVHWLVIAVCYLLGDWHNTGGITALMVAVYCGYIYLNLRMNKEHFPFTDQRISPVD